jgi:uncharacterized protein YbjT (DUF2867 family)
MPTYAILSATGNCGTALIENLCRDPEAMINAYCRNGKKLAATSPQLASNDRVKIFEGSIDDVDLLLECINGATAIFHAVSTNANVPGCDVGQKTAETIVKALEKLKR